MRFLVHGSIAYDLLLTFEGSFIDAIDPQRLQDLSVSYFMPRSQRHHGGTGANIAWNLALLGQEPFLVGSVGHDGTSYLDLLREKGVYTETVDVLGDHTTALAVIGTDQGERQIAFFHPGADAFGTLPDLSSHAASIAHAVIAPRNMTLMIAAARQCAELGIPYLFDPGQQSHLFAQAEFRTAVSQSAGLIVNEYEWGLASKALGWSEEDVVRACGMLIVTKGERGLTLHNRTAHVQIPACTADRVVNPTGAGDTLRAGILYGLGAGWDLGDCGRLGAAMGSFVVEHEGTLLPSLTWEQVRERVKRAYGEGLPG